MRVSLASPQWTVAFLVSIILYVEGGAGNIYTNTEPMRRRDGTENLITSHEAGVWIRCDHRTLVVPHYRSATRASQR